MIVGASVRAAAHSAIRSGFIPTCADLFADADLTNVCNACVVDDFPTGLGAIIEASKSDAWLYTGALENRTDLLRSWAISHRLLGNSADIVKSVRNPLNLRDVLQRSGLPCANIKLHLDCADDRSQWIRKPYRSASGMDIDFASNVVPEKSHDHYFQQFIRGDAQSAVFVATKKVAQLLGITQQLIGTPWCGVDTFRYAGSVGPLAVTNDMTRRWHRIGAVLASEFDLQGLFGVDAVVNEHGIFTIEVNPRYTASVEVLELANPNVAAIRRHVAACRDQTISPFAPFAAASRVYAKAILFADRKLAVSPSFLDRLLRENKQTNTLRFADIPHPGSIEKGWPILTVFGRGDTVKSALSDAKARAAEMRLALTEI